MAYNIIADFFNLVDLGLFDTASVLLIICFIIYEIPRSIKIMDEEFTKGLYPEHGRVVDFVLAAIGIGAVALFMSEGTKIVKFLKTPGVLTFFLILLVVIPLIILLGYFKRLAGKLERGESITVFLVQGFLDLMHTLFFISVAVLVIPSVGYLLFG